MTDIKEQVIRLRKKGYTYYGISIELDKLSNNFIKETLQEYAPELV